MLLYFPFADLIHDGQEKLPLFTVHNQDTWLQPTRFYQTAMELWNHGVTFDFTSDDLLSRATVRDGKIILGNNSFKALVLPGVKRIPIPTMEIILKLARQGGRIIVQDGPPSDVPGFHDYVKRLAELNALNASDESRYTSVSGSILPALASCGVLQERMSDSGLRFVRRAHAGRFPLLHREPQRKTLRRKPAARRALRKRRRAGSMESGASGHRDIQGNPTAP